VDIDWTDPDSLHNWVEKLDLTCKPSWKIGMLGSAFFIGWICTILIIPRQSDTHGRKIFWQVGMFLQTLCFVVMDWTHSLDVMIGVIFMIGCLSSIRISIGYVYMMELLPKNKQTAVGSTLNVMEGFTLLAITIYYAFISQKWVYSIAFAFLLQLTALVCSFFLSESPRLLIKQGKIAEAKAVFATIARVNQKELVFNEADFI